MYVRMSNCFLGTTQTPPASAAVRRGAALTGRHREWERAKICDAFCIAGEHRHLHDARPLLGPPWATVLRRLLRRARRARVDFMQTHVPKKVALQRLCSKKVALQ